MSIGLFVKYKFDFSQLNLFDNVIYTFAKAHFLTIYLVFNIYTNDKKQ